PEYQHLALGSGRGPGGATRHQQENPQGRYVMIDAYQATSVAITTEDGGIYHDSHFQAEFDRLWEIANAEAEAEGERRYGRLAEQLYDELKAEAGLHSVIRYTIHEMEAEKAWE